MSDKSIIDNGVNFSENHKSEVMGEGANACRTTVIIKHRDSLGDYRILPEGIMVVVYDEAGNTYKARIDRSGFSHHKNVRCGEISWQLMKSSVSATPREAYDKSGIKRQLSEADESFTFDKSDGYLLIQANDVKSNDPRKQFAEPLKVFAGYSSDGVANIEAIYLPPPMLLNFRFNQTFNQQEETRNKERIKQQIFASGKNVTLFIHGFNVPLGKTGRFPTAKELGKIPAYDALPLSSEQVQTPYVYYSDIIGDRLKNEVSKVNKVFDSPLYSQESIEPFTGKKVKSKNSYAEQAIKIAYTDMELKLTGDNALSWFPSVEYYLNLAASGKLSPSEPFTDWDKYSRILGITWSGNISPANVFFRAEMYANETGRDLAKFIQELDKDTKINIITHSLGARVALSALNILGDFDGEYDNRIDNLIMLEAAVADNAITKNYIRENNPLAMELFPFAHKAVKSMRVMYSLEDGVLGGDSTPWDTDDGFITDNILIRGAYPKKYGPFANRTHAIGDYYPYDKNARTSISHQKAKADIHNAIQIQCLDNMGQNSKDVAALCDYMKSQESFGRQMIESKARELIAQEIEHVNQDRIADLNILRPWSHFRRFPKDADYTQHIIDVLMNVIFKGDWKMSSEELAIRPALGYLGEMLTAPNPRSQIDEQLAKKYPMDKFIVELKDKQFSFWDQSAYFTTHSAMKDLIWEEMVRTEEQRESMKPTRFSQIYTITYKREIMDRYIKEISKFGRY